MAFTRPWILPLLPVIVAIIVFIHKRSTGRKARLASALQGKVGPSAWKLLSAAMAASMLIIALSQPVVSYREKIPVNSIEDMIKYNEKLPAQYIILVDVSPSMHTGNPLRLDTALKVVRMIVDDIKDNGTIMLSVFGGRVEQLYVGAPSNISRILYMIRNYDIKYTAIGDAIGYAVSCAGASRLPSIAVIITDGANNYGPDPVQTYIYANKTHLPILFIRVDSDPRANQLFAELARHDAYIVSASSFNLKSLEPVIEHAIQRMKYTALVETGKNYIVVNRITNLPTMILGAVAVVAIILSRMTW